MAASIAADPPPPLPQPDQGSGHFAETVRCLRREQPELLVECLTPDFRGAPEPITVVARSGLHVYAHNVETVARMQGRVRDHRAGYRQSIGVLETAKAAVPTLLTKTSIMLGLGEREGEVRETLRDLRAAGVDVVTFGQYLRPTKRHMPVDRFVTPEEFDAWRVEAEGLGFAYVASGPLVRSSYRAGEYYLEALVKGRLAAGAAGVASVGGGAAGVTPPTVRDAYPSALA